jgi:hypothetical protein
MGSVGFWIWSFLQEFGDGLIYTSREGCAASTKVVLAHVPLLDNIEPKS